VQTADEKILGGSTAYITDLGLCGPSRSIIGSDVALSITRQMTQMPIRSQVADTPPVLQGVAVTIETATGKALSITRFSKEYAI